MDIAKIYNKKFYSNGYVIIKDFLNIFKSYTCFLKQLIIKPGMVFFMHMILMDSEAQLAMNLGETYLVTETGNERLGKQKLDLVVL